MYGVTCGGGDAAAETGLQEAIASAVVAVVDASPSLEVLDLSASKGNAKISDQGLQAVARLRYLKELNVTGLHACTGVLFEVPC